jgi:hypothetical protein
VVFSKPKTDGAVFSTAHSQLTLWGMPFDLELMKVLKGRATIPVEGVAAWA